MIVNLRQKCHLRLLSANCELCCCGSLSQKTDPFLRLCPSPVDTADVQTKGQGIGLGGGLGGGMGGGLDQEQIYQENAFQTSTREFLSTDGQTNMYTSGRYGQGFYGDAGFMNYSEVIDTWRTNELYLDKVRRLLDK